jgi:hypothetical protein
MAELIAARREKVISDYKAAAATNRCRFLEKNEKATAEYIFDNQIIDANLIVQEFYDHNRRVVSVTKKTKVGADGLMIEIVKLMTTHSDDDFVMNPDNIRIITGMSNKTWEDDMKEKSPECFRKNIYHHGKLTKANLIDLKDSLIIIDEIDTGDKEEQVLHTTLKEAGILDITYMTEHNLRFVLISATMIKELYELYKWGDLHQRYNMTIPTSYIGHIDFLSMNILKEFYSLETNAEAKRWIREDILDNYKSDYRIHIVRVNAKTRPILEYECVQHRIPFRNHTSKDRLTPSDEVEFFKTPLTNHIVLGVKGLLRRANLIPNAWKLRIGATHELYTSKVDNNVQIQGLSGRMTGYWRAELEGGHVTGPHRTSVKAIQEYEKIYMDPYGINSYKTSGFTKNKGTITKLDSTFLSHVEGFNPLSLPAVEEDKDHRIFTNQDDAIKFAKDTFMIDLQKRTDSTAPKELMKDGINPTVEYLLKRMWGIDAKSKLRMCPTNDNTWCIYWKPSLCTTSSTLSIHPP